MLTRVILVVLIAAAVAAANKTAPASSVDDQVTHLSWAASETEKLLTTSERQTQKMQETLATAETQMQRLLDVQKRAIDNAIQREQQMRQDIAEYRELAQAVRILAKPDAYPEEEVNNAKATTARLGTQAKMRLMPHAPSVDDVQ